MKRSLRNYFYSIFISILFIVIFASNFSLVKAKSSKDIPCLDYIALENMPFIEGVSNALFVSSKNYSEDIQYQVLYKSADIPKDALKIVNNDNTINGWTNPTKSKELYKVDISNLKLSAGNYKFYIRIKRAARVGEIKSIYGNHDSEHSFTLEVIRSEKIGEEIGVQIGKKYYSKDDYFIFGNLDNPSVNVIYKLHLYDLKNEKWLSNLTEYNSSINYSLSSIPVGTYLVDIWYKSTLSGNNYDGFKLSIIEVKNESSSENLNESTPSSKEFARKQSKVQEKLYFYLTNSNNREMVKERAFSLNDNSEGGSCVYFVSEALRRVDVNLDDSVCTTGQLNNEGSKYTSLTSALSNMGWKSSKDISLLTPGDICFSTPLGGGEGKPTHSYIFMGWVENNNMKYAYICDNQISDYGSVYHIRNIKDSTPDKEAFYYFMYNPI